MLEVALADRLEDQRVLVAVRLGRTARCGYDLGQQAALGPQLRGQALECAHETSLNAAAAASTVRVTCSGVWASDGNQASNCEAGG